jgi:predicted nucleic acid-binding protein
LDTNVLSVAAADIVGQGVELDAIEPNRVVFTTTILPFDSAAAPDYADIAAARRRSGRPPSDPDSRIAAVARSRGAEVATRNVADFAGCQLEVINPWL